MLRLKLRSPSALLCEPEIPSSGDHMQGGGPDALLWCPCDSQPCTQVSAAPRADTADTGVRGGHTALAPAEQCVFVTAFLGKENHSIVFG